MGKTARRFPRPWSSSTPWPFAKRRRLSFSAHTLTLLLIVMALVVVLTAGVYTWIAYQRITAQVEARALNNAQTVATAPLVRRQTAKLNAHDDMRAQSILARGALQQYAVDVEDRTGALFVVITDDDGIRLAHPNPDRLGKHVSTSPKAALNGHEVTAVQRGTLGVSARAKVPIYDRTGTIVGEVSFGFSTRQRSAAFLDYIPEIAGIAAAALLLGAGASWLISRRLRRLTLGLQPDDLASLVAEQEAVLHGVDNGVIGVSPDRRVTVFNAEAARLLSVEPPLGTAIEDAGLPPELVRLLEKPASEPMQFAFGQRILVSLVHRVNHGDRELGWVIMIRDRTDVESLTRQLDAVGTLSQALRAHRHEFANRLHTLAGLLKSGHPDRAEEYLSSVIATGPLEFPAEDLDLIRDTYLASFLGAKSALASERGVTVRVGPNSAVHDEVSQIHDVTTVLGNLVDNAITAAVDADPPRWIEVDVLSDADTLHIAVTDSGTGIRADENAVFAEGFSTGGQQRDSERDSEHDSAHDSAHGQGVGLPLCRRIARRRGGDLWVASSGTDDHGATFCARLPGVLIAARSTEDARSADDTESIDDAQSVADTEGQWSMT